MALWAISFANADDAPLATAAAPQEISTESEPPTASEPAIENVSENVALAGAQNEADVDVDDEDDIGDQAGKITATYFGIFYGPSVSKPTSFQPTEDGSQDSNRPVMLKNFAGVGYNLTDHLRITPTAYWQWLPSAGGAYAVQDPFVKISDDSIISEGNFNLYGDFRYHAPISNFSKAANITGSYQSVQVATYVPEGTRWMLALFSSERAYTYGKGGYGNDFEVYVGPNVGYQISPRVQLTMLYETNLVHVYGNNPGTMEGDGTDLQPGVSVDITNRLNVHPYLSIYPSAPSIASTSVGALLYWQAF